MLSELQSDAATLSSELYGERDEPKGLRVLCLTEIMHQVTYKSIIQLFEAEHNKKDYPDDQDRIPKLIKNAVGSMPFDRFEQLRRTIAFQ